MRVVGNSGVEYLFTIIFRLLLSTVTRRLGRKTSTKEKLELAGRQQRLQLRIDDFQSHASQLWPVDDDDIWLEGTIIDPTNLLPSDSEEEELFSSNNDAVQEGPEKALLLLPSNIGLAKCIALGYENFIKQEKGLRIGQMNDALHGLRLAISRKAVIFRDGLRSSRSKNQKTRSWDEILQVDGSVRHQARLYCRARIAFTRLGPDTSEINRFQPLTRAQLSVTTARIDPSLRGQRDSALAWFWSMDVQADGQAVNGMTECELSTSITLSRQLTNMPVYRVHWLKAKSRRDRWREERILLASEMEWTELFFRHRASRWKALAAESSAIALPDSDTGDELEPNTRYSQGHICYALKQESMWDRLAQQATLQFNAAKADIEPSQHFARSRSSSESSL